VLLALLLCCVPVDAQQAAAPNAVAGQVGAGANSTEDVGQQLSELPLEWAAPEELETLNSAANDAAIADRSAGNAGGEGAEDGSGSPRATVQAGEASTGMSYGGLAPQLNESTLDELSLQQSFRAGPRGAAADGPRRPSIYGLGGIQSFRLMGQGESLAGGRGGDGLREFSAQYGGAGGVTEATTRAGSEQVRGSAMLLSQESALAAMNPYSIATRYRDGVVTSTPVKPAGLMNQLGVFVGLPVAWRGMPSHLRDRATLAASLNMQLHEDKIVSSPASASFFSLTAEQMTLLQTRGVSAAATNTALDYLSSLTGTTSRNAFRASGMLRMDVVLSKRDIMTFGYTGDYADAPAGAVLGQASDAVVARGTGSLGDSFINVEAGSAHWLHQFSKRWDNEVRGQVAHDLEYETPRSPLPQEPAIGPGGLAPQVSIGPQGFAYGTPSTLGRMAYPDELRFEVADTMRLRLGRHAFAVGGDWSRVHDRIASLTAEEGAFLYDSGTTGGHDGGLVDWITDYTFNVNAYPNGGCPSIRAAVHDFCFHTYTQGFGVAATEFVTHEVAGFAEDSVRARRDLMLTMGVRYDYTLLPLPQTPNEVLDADLAAVGVTAATSQFPEDRNNFGPRAAMLWSPGWMRGVSVQAGYGAYYGRVPGATIRAALTDTGLPSSSEQIRIVPTTETPCPQVTAVVQVFGYPCAFTGVPPAVVAQTTSVMMFAKNFRSPMVQRGSFTVEDAVSRRLTLRASYAMAAAKQLAASTDVNIAPSTGYVSYVLQGGDAYRGLHSGETFAVPLYSQRLVSQYGAVTEIESNANAYYSAGTVEATWHGERGLAARGSYTFSRAIDTGPQQSATPSLSTQFDPFQDGYDKGLSNLQFPQRFAGDLEYQLHWIRGSQELRKALDGWRVAAIGTAGSGAPYSYSIFGGTRLSGGHETINGSGGATYLPTVGRNTLRLPPRGKLDLRVGREFAAGSRVRVHVFAEAFNLLNERNVSSVETRAFLLGTPVQAGASTPLVFQDSVTIASEGLTTPSFGTANSSTTGMSRERRVQFGVRAQF
jgi:hypothetical protein